MKVMYLIFEGFDTANGTNHLLIAAMQEFLNNNIEVYLVTSHSVGKFSDIPKQLKIQRGFSYSVIQRKAAEKKDFARRYIDGMFYAVRAAREWKKHRNSIDVVILQSTPTAFFSAFLLHMYMRKPVIYNSFDVFPDGPFLFGAIRNKAIFVVMLAMQSYIYRTSSKITVISEDMKNTFLKKGIKKSKLALIPNWYEADAVREVVGEENRFIKKYKINKKKFIVQYAGNFGYTFHYHAVIEVAKLLKKHPEIEFHMVGTGGFEDDFKKDTIKEGLENIRFFSWQDSEIINDVYSSCDIELIPLAKGVIWTSFPSKCALLMACGRTFLCMCEKKSDFYRFINENKAGICVSRTDYSTAAEMILRLYVDRKYLVELEKNARKCAEKYFSSADNARKYVDLFQELCREE